METKYYQYCRLCGASIKPSHGRHQTDKFCHACFEAQLHDLAYEDAYCAYCGKLMEKKLYKGVNGVFYRSSKKQVFCDDCRQIREDDKQKPKKRCCVVCGGLVPTSAHKYCENCKPNKNQYKKNPNKKLHRKFALKWQKENPKKTKVAQLARYHADKVRVIYECRCISDKKVNHHFDYDRPFEVVKLCPACHSAEHARLRKLANEALWTTTLSTELNFR